MANDLQHSTPARALPPEYAHLASFAAGWARPTEVERNEIRLAATRDDFASFYEAFMPHLRDILDLLSHHQLETMPPDVRYLFDLTCAFAEAAPHHELYGGSAEVPHSFESRRVVPGHTAFALEPANREVGSA